MKSIREEMQKSITGTIKAKILRIGLPCFVVHAPPNIIGVAAFDYLHRFANDDRAFVSAVLFEQAERYVSHFCFPQFFSHSCSSLSARAPQLRRLKRHARAPF